MHVVDPDYTYCRGFYTNGHKWKLYEVHDKVMVKKTDWFEPRRETARKDMGLTQPRFFDDHEHMLSVIGLLRYALQIRENMIDSEGIMQVLEKEPNRMTRAQSQKFIPFEREDVPHALEPGKHKTNRYLTSTERKRQEAI